MNGLGHQHSMPGNETANGPMIQNSIDGISMNSQVSEYDQWRSNHPQLLPSAFVMSSTANPADTYIPSYYPPISSYPQPLSDHGADTLYGSGFGSPPSPYVGTEATTINLFGGGTGSNTTGAYQLPFNFYTPPHGTPGAGDYAAAWGTSPIVSSTKHVDPYRDHRYTQNHFTDMYPTGLRQLEQGVANLGIVPGAPGPTLTGGLMDAGLPPPTGHVLETGLVSSAVSQSTGPPAPKSWASIASQPAKNQNGTSNATAVSLKAKMTSNVAVPMERGFGGRYEDYGSRGGQVHQPRSWSHAANRSGGGRPNVQPRPNPPPAEDVQQNGSTDKDNPVLAKLSQDNAFNPREFTLDTRNARYFVIKSYSEDDIHRSIKYSIWCSTEHGNKRLDNAYKEQKARGGHIYLLFSVNGSGHFCGVAEMETSVDYNTSAGVWAQDKWKGQLRVRWVYVKDVPNSQLRHIRLENNEGKPVTNSRDTQEVYGEKGRQILHIIHRYQHTTSIFDDFTHYERRQEADQTRKQGHGRRDPE